MYYSGLVEQSPQQSAVVWNWMLVTGLKVNTFQKNQSECDASDLGLMMPFQSGCRV